MIEAPTTLTVQGSTMPRGEALRRGLRANPLLVAGAVSAAAATWTDQHKLTAPTTGANNELAMLPTSKHSLLLPNWLDQSELDQSERDLGG